MSKSTNAKTLFQKKQTGSAKFRAGTFNVRSLKSNSKKISIVEDFERYKLDVLCLTETWINGNGVDVLDGGHVLYRSGGSSSRAGVGILVNKNLVNNVEAYKFCSERVISVRFKTGSRRDSNSLTVVSCYAPTLQRSTSHPAEANVFYSSLEGIVKSIKKRDEVWLLGDLNAKVASSGVGSRGPVGCFSKHTQTNANGERLIEFCEENGLILCNTMFKHRMQHRATWFSDGLSHRDGQPVRNMIDYVIMRRSETVRVTDARSYGGFSTRSDHHPVIADFQLTFWRSKSLKKADDRCFIKYNDLTPDSAKVFCDMLANTLPSLEVPPETAVELDDIWASFVSATHEAAATAFGKAKPGKRPTRTSNPQVAELSIQQKQLHMQMHMEKDPDKRKSMKQERNKIQHRIRSLLKEDDDRFWQNKADEIDALRPDARSYFNAIRQMKTLRNSDKPAPVRLANDEGEVISDVQWNLKKFNSYFSSVFYRDDLPMQPSPACTDNEVEEAPFTVEETKKSISHQKVAGAVGCDGISATINTIQKLHYCPCDLRCGILVPIYKSGKPAGLPKSYRPVMLLSIVRKVLTRIITMRTSRSSQAYVRESQAGFKPGRSTADGVFYTRTLCERALLGDWSYSAALLDFSGAFDTIFRDTALTRLSESGAATGVIGALISDTTVRVKLSSQLSTPFDTNIGVVQGHQPLNTLMTPRYMTRREERWRRWWRNRAPCLPKTT